MRYKMIVSYDGAYFHGFQRQKGYNSVQETLEQIFSHILKTEVVVKSAGRTDAGVHAYGQVIHFDSEQLIPPSNFKKISNKLLFPHIYIKDVKCVNTEFHSRVSAISKEYHYLVDIGEFCPLKSNYRHYFHNRIDIDKIKEQNLTLNFEGQAPYFKEANLVLCLKKMYAQEMNENSFVDKSCISKWYPGNDYHTMYVCEITKVLSK